jgi:hypothetical protein
MICPARVKVAAIFPELSFWLFRCSGRLFSKTHRKSLDLSDLRPANRMASLPPLVIAEKQFTANHPTPAARNNGRAKAKSRNHAG